MTDEWITKDVHVHNGYYSATQNEIGSSVEMWLDPGLVRQRKEKTNIVYSCIYMESRKMIQMNLFPRQE